VSQEGRQEGNAVDIDKAREAAMVKY